MAQEPDFGDYVNLSVVGDGQTLSASQLFAAQERALSIPSGPSAVNDRGDLSYSVPLDLPPALHMPEVQIGYSSSGGHHSPLTRGWSVSAGGMTIDRITGTELNHYPEVAANDFTQPHRVSGGGLSGLIVWRSGQWAYIGPEPVNPIIVQNGEEWTVTVGGVSRRLAAYRSSGPVGQADSWRVVRSIDAAKNCVDYSYTGVFLDAVEYGGTCDGLTASGTLEPHFLRVAFVREARTAGQDGLVDDTILRAHNGNVDVFDERVVAVTIASSYFHPTNQPLLPVNTGSLVWDGQVQRAVLFDYVDADGHTLLARIEDAGPNQNRVLAEFEYAEFGVTDPGYVRVSEGLFSSHPSDPGDLTVPGDNRAITLSPQVTPGATGFMTPARDVTGDGLMDLWDPDNGWRWLHWVGSQGNDLAYSTPTPSLDMAPPLTNQKPKDSPAAELLSEDVHFQVRPQGEWFYSLSIGWRVATDVDGDGFTDLVTAASNMDIPYALGSDAYSSTSWTSGGSGALHGCTGDALCGTDADWSIQYGSEFGYMPGDERMVESPATYPDLGRSPVVRLSTDRFRVAVMQSGG